MPGRIQRENVKHLEIVCGQYGSRNTDIIGHYLEFTTKMELL